MTTTIRGWIRRDKLDTFTSHKDEARWYEMGVQTFPLLTDDICIEMTIVSPQQLEREADEGLKALDGD